MKKEESLLYFVLMDLKQHYFAVLLVIIILLSAFYNIYITHNTRLLITQKEQLSQDQDNLAIEWNNLLIEENSFAEHSRIRKIAIKELSMVQPTSKSIVLVTLP